MKKVVSLMLVLVLIFGTVGCSSQNEPGVFDVVEVIEGESEPVEETVEEPIDIPEEEPELVEEKSKSEELIEEYGILTEEDIDFYWENEPIFEGIPKPIDFEVVLESFSVDTAVFYLVNIESDTYKKYTRMVEMSDFTTVLMDKSGAMFSLENRNLFVEPEEDCVSIMIL